MPSAVTFCYLTALKVSAQISNLPEEFPCVLVCLCVCVCVRRYCQRRDMDKNVPQLLIVAAREKCFVTKNFKTEKGTEEKRRREHCKALQVAQKFEVLLKIHTATFFKNFWHTKTWDNLGSRAKPSLPQRRLQLAFPLPVRGASSAWSRSGVSSTLDKLLWQLNLAARNVRGEDVAAVAEGEAAWAQPCALVYVRNIRI